MPMATWVGHAVHGVAADRNGRGRRRGDRYPSRRLISPSYNRDEDEALQAGSAGHGVAPPGHHPLQSGTDSAGGSISMSLSSAKLRIGLPRAPGCETEAGLRPSRSAGRGADS
jgi:hypothetical protein